MDGTFPDKARVRALIRKTLEEDGTDHDRTVEFLAIGQRPMRARIIAGAPGVLAGVGVARMTFEEQAPRVKFDDHMKDGKTVGAGDIVAEVSGPADGILAAERVALNFLQHLSGVATLTARFVGGVGGKGVTILDTRKTLPLLRELQRYAVRVGGGANHRFNLSDMILIKENHIRATGGVDKLLELIPRREAAVAVEVEVDSLGFLRELLGAPVDRIMLDNFSPGDVRQALAMMTEFYGESQTPRPEIEVSGGIDLDTVGEYALNGVDFISVGALTHSAPALDFNLEVVGDDA